MPKHILLTLLTIACGIALAHSTAIPQPLTTQESPNMGLESSREFQIGQSIPLIVHSVWDGDLPLVFKRTMESWRVMNPLWQIRQWTIDEVKSHITANFHWFSNTFESMSGYERLLVSRFFILESFGGVFTDVNIECISSLDSLLNQIKSQNPGVVLAREQSGIISMDIMASVPEHKLWNALESLRFSSPTQSIVSVFNSTIQRFLQNPINHDILVLPFGTLLGNATESASNFPSPTVIAVSHHKVLNAINNVTIVSDVDVDVNVIIRSRVLLTMETPVQTNGLEFLADYWNILKHVFSNNLDVPCNLIDLIEFAAVDESSFVFDFSVSTHGGFQKSVISQIEDLINSRVLESKLREMSVQVVDAVLLFGPHAVQEPRSEQNLLQSPITHHKITPHISALISHTHHTDVITSSDPTPTPQPVQCTAPELPEPERYQHNCAEVSEQGNVCVLSCAQGYKASGNQNVEMRCEEEGWIVVDGELQCDLEITCSTEFLEHATGVIHDCENNAVPGTTCRLSCAPGYSSGDGQDHTDSYCVLHGEEASYNTTKTCTSALCSLTSLPEGVEHNCVDGSVVGTTCALRCATGTYGDAVIATCVGSGGKGDIPASAEFTADTLNCVDYVPVNPEPPMLERVLVYSYVEEGDVQLMFDPVFKRNVTSYTLELPHRFTNLRFEYFPSLSWVTILNVTCNGCETATETGIVLGNGLHEFTITVTYANDPFAITSYEIFIKRQEPLSPFNPEVLGAKIILDTPIEENWVSSHGTPFKQTIAQTLNISSDDVYMRFSWAHDGVYVFAIRVDGDAEEYGLAFENALASKRFHTTLCQISQVCPTEIVLKSPLHVYAGQVSFTHSISSTPLPTATPTQENSTSSQQPHNPCLTHRGSVCITQFIRRGCPTNIRDFSIVLDGIHLRNETRMSSDCESGDYDVCYAEARKASCMHPLRLISSCAALDDVRCEQGYILNHCNSSYYQPSMCDAKSSCHAMVQSHICPAVTRCSSKEAKACTQRFTANQCSSLITSRGCDAYIECQIEAKVHRSKQCMSPTPEPTPGQCNSQEAIACINDLITAKCIRPITTFQCLPYLACQAAVKQGRDSRFKCPEHPRKHQPPVSVTPTNPLVTSDVSVMMWLHLLLVYRFQYMFPGTGSPYML